MTPDGLKIPLANQITALKTEYPPTHMLNTFSERILSSSLNSLKVGLGTALDLFMRIRNRRAINAGPRARVEKL
jgi:hypothetical protein